ncbi:MAG TPA: enoyl-CoA hydratase-related protein [bacterium]|nr:enoyl-CoA hydratase-related protein [bacterium]
MTTATETSYKNLLLDRRDTTAILTINRPDKLNALNNETMAELACALTGLERDQEIRGIIITGSGEKAFIAGADINELAVLTPIAGSAHARHGQAVLQQIEDMPKLVVAAINGFCLGGGMELALACHCRVATPNAMLGLPEVTLGIIPGYGGTQRLPRIVGKGRALELIATGKMINAEEAHRIGLVNQIAGEGQSAVEAALELLNPPKSKAVGPVAVAMAIKAVNTGMSLPLSDALDYETQLFGLLATTADMKEGMTAFIEKRGAAFRGE